MAKAKLWWRAVRPFSFTVSVVPPVLGGIIAGLENPGLDFNWFHFLLTLIGCVLAHAGANLLSDYFDYKKRVDREGTFGSSGVLVEKLMQPGEILFGAWVALGIAALIGVYLILSIPNGLFLFWLILIGGALAVFYTAGPISFKYHALGDFAVFISFGSAMVLGAYFVQAHHFSWAPVLYAIPIALLVDAVLHGNNLRDIENDKAVDIKTVPIIVGEKSAKTIYYGLIFGAYLTTLILVAVAEMPVVTLLTFLSLPLALKLVKMVRDKEKLPVQQFAMIDAATAQFHTAFSLLLLVALLVQYFIVS